MARALPKPKKLPNYRKAKIKRDKLVNFLLNPSGEKPDRAAFFRSLGYNMKNHRRLEKDIRAGIAQNNVTKVFRNKYNHDAIMYNVSMPLGINKQVYVITGWEMENNVPNFVTAIPDRKRNKK